MNDFEAKVDDQEWLLSNLERKPTFSDRLHFYFQTRFNRRPYKSFRCISNKGGFLPKLFLYNGLVNSKYNLITFIPLVLYSQFSSFINLFYLAMCLSQLIPLLRVEAPIVHMFPLSLVIFVFSLKEAIEDYKRHMRDKEHNRQKFSVFSDKGYVDVSSEKLKMGQLIMLKQGQRVPADILLLKTSEDNGSSFVRTDQLDGETDWKLKRAVATTQLMNVEDIYNLLSVATVEEPKPDFYNFTGKITFYHPAGGDKRGGHGDHAKSGSHESTTPRGGKTKNQNAGKTEKKGSKEESSAVTTVKIGGDGRKGIKYDLVVESLNVDNVIWMNSIVANGTIHALVIYVGKDARACLNSKRSRAKTGLFDKELNKLFVILIILMLIMTILLIAPAGFTAKWYITLIKYLLLFSTIVPLSLRISLDIAKYVYNRSILTDKNIPKAVPRTTMIPEELGRIQYLLSDKTGTLTQNVISLEKIYVSRGFYTIEDLEVIKDTMISFLLPGSAAANALAKRPTSFFGENSGANQENTAAKTPKKNPATKSKPATANQPSGKPQSSDSLSSATNARDEKEVIRDIFNPNLGENLESRLCLALLSCGICHNVRPTSSADDMPDAHGSGEKGKDGLPTSKSRAFFRRLKYYLKANRGRPYNARASSQQQGGPNRKPPERLRKSQSSDLDASLDDEEAVEFQASSPDEIALVKFAYKCDFKLVFRDDYSMHLLVHGLLLKFKILFMIPFSSETKRMGIIVEDACGGKHFFIKGAEVVIIPFLLPRGSVWLSEECDNMARMGLRTLVFGYRSITDHEFNVFMAKYKEANVSLVDRIKKIRAVTATLEHDLTLVGLTGVRDQLQRNVASTIESLRNAGIKIWMLTGDKIDTAKCVAISAGLKQKHHLLYQISVESLMNPMVNPSASASSKHFDRVDKEMIDFINSYDRNAHARESTSEKAKESKRSKRKKAAQKTTFDTKETDYVRTPQQEKMEYYETCMAKVTEIIEWNLEHFRMGPADSVLIMDSFVIGIALERLRKLFLKSTTMASSVLCCRCTPQMKADMVKLLRTSKQIVCCIGDGDNDVPMITEANVGIGLVGKEGLQASLSSDYSLIEFSHLKRLLLWHGRNSYKRSSKMSHFLMHRGVVLSVMQAIFSSIYYSMPIAFFQGWLLVGFTSYYNMVPIFCLVLDVEISDDDVMLYPELYHELRSGRVMNVKTFLIWIWISVFQGTVLMVGAIILFENSLVSLIAIGCTSLFILEILNLVAELNTWHRLTIIGIMATSVVYFYSLLVFRNNFDMEFIARKSFLWKVSAISLLGWIPVYSIKWLTNLLKPPQYVKLIVS